MPKSSIKATVFANSDMPMIFTGVKEVTFVDNNSHGGGPAGDIQHVIDGDSRLILSSPNIIAAYLESE